MPPAGSWQTGYRDAGRAGFMLYDYTAMLSHRQLHTRMFPDSQETYYLKKAQQHRGC